MQKVCITIKGYVRLPERIKVMRKQMLLKPNTNLFGASLSKHFNPVCPNYVYDYAITGLEHGIFGDYRTEYAQRYRCIT